MKQDSERTKLMLTFEQDICVAMISTIFCNGIEIHSNCRCFYPHSNSILQMDQATGWFASLGEKVYALTHRQN